MNIQIFGNKKDNDTKKHSVFSRNGESGFNTLQGEKSIHCRRCGERSRIVKYSLEDEKNIGKNAFRGIPRKASVYVPPGKMKSYQKWLKKAGLKCQGGKKWKR